MSNTTKVIEMDIECPSCQGTGVYVGMAERGGAAVVCNKCNGTGKYHYRFEYKEFSGLKTREGVKRVFKSTYGFVIAPTKLNFDGIGDVDMSKEGVSYEDFKKGQTPKHVKSIACPMLADQSACHDIKGFVEECDKLNGGSLIGKWITECNNQPNKLSCWERFELNKKEDNDE